MLKIQPIGDRIVARRIEQKPGEAKIGTLFIPDAAKDAPLLAKVEAVGPGRASNWPGAAIAHGLMARMGALAGMSESVPIFIEFTRQQPMIEVGDLVIYARYSGVEIPIHVGEKIETVFMLREDEVMARIPKADVEAFGFKEQEEEEPAKVEQAS